MTCKRIVSSKATVVVVRHFSRGSDQPPVRHAFTDDRKPLPSLR